MIAEDADSVAVTSDVSKALLEIQESAAKVASLVEEIAGLQGAGKWP